MVVSAVVLPKAGEGEQEKECMVVVVVVVGGVVAAVGGNGGGGVCGHQAVCPSVRVMMTAANL